MTRRALSDSEASAGISWLWSSARRAVDSAEVAAAECGGGGAAVGAGGGGRVCWTGRRGWRGGEGGLGRAQVFRRGSGQGLNGHPCRKLARAESAPRNAS